MNRTKSTIVSLIKSGAPFWAVILLLVVFVLVTGNAGSAFAQRPDQRAFASAEAAANALFVAVQSHDEAAVMDILGAENELISTGDDVQDKLEHEQFVKK